MTILMTASCSFVSGKPFLTYLVAWRLHALVACRVIHGSWSHLCRFVDCHLWLHITYCQCGKWSEFITVVSLRKVMSFECCFAVVSASSSGGCGPAPGSCEPEVSSVLLYTLFESHTSLQLFITLCRLVHSFTCAGVLQSQYVKLCSFAGIGTVRNAYIRHGIY